MHKRSKIMQQVQQQKGGGTMAAKQVSAYVCASKGHGNDGFWAKITHQAPSSAHSLAIKFLCAQYSKSASQTWGACP